EGPRRPRPGDSPRFPQWWPAPRPAACSAPTLPTSTSDHLRQHAPGRARRARGSRLLPLPAGSVPGRAGRGQALPGSWATPALVVAAAAPVPAAAGRERDPPASTVARVAGRLATPARAPPPLRFRRRGVPSRLLREARPP